MAGLRALQGLQAVTSAATDRVYHLDPITLAKGGGGVLAARHYIQVEFDRQTASRQIQAIDQLGDGLPFGQFEGFTV